MEIVIQPTAEAASVVAARIVAQLVRRKPDAVLGLATGSTPLPMYRELVRMHREDVLDFSQIHTFNLDEYIGLPREHPQSYYAFMWENLFHHINVARENTRSPNSLAADVPGECAAYENAIRAVGGIDLQVLGIGTDGHIGFNEPLSSLASRTRIKTLTARTRSDNARFFGTAEEVPIHVITMGVGTIMDARQVLMLAFGGSKAKAVADAIEGPIMAMNPASILQMHQNAKFIIDDPAASKLAHIDYYQWVYDHRPQWQQFEK